MSCDDTLFELANEVFDKVVLRYDDEFEAYNNGGERLHSELLSIVGDMVEAAEDAMYEVAEQSRDGFIELLKEEA